MHYKQLGNSDYPYDEFIGLTLSYIETYILANAKDRDDLFSEVWAHKPSNMKHNVLYNLFDENFYPR